MGVAVGGGVKVNVAVGIKVLVLDAVIVGSTTTCATGATACAVHAVTKSIPVKITNKLFFIIRFPCESVDKVYLLRKQQEAVYYRLLSHIYLSVYLLFLRLSRGFRFSQFFSRTEIFQVAH